MIKFCNLGKGFIAGRDHHATGTLKGFHGVVSAHGAETMSDNVFDIQIFEPVKHAGIGAVRVFFKVEYGTVVIFTLRSTDDIIAGFGREKMSAKG